MINDVADDVSTGIPATKRIESNIYARSVDTGGERLTGFVSATSATYRSPIGRKTAHVDRAPRGYSHSLPAQQDALRRELNIAANCALRMEKTATSRDLIELANTGFMLRDSLNQLWQLRHLREDDWGDLLNLLQTALASEEFERFSPNQCKVIYSVVNEHLRNGITDIDDLDAVIVKLRQARLDPFKSISITDEFDTGKR